jgi:GNAT superfamily N-acetyltransferase
MTAAGPNVADPGGARLAAKPGGYKVVRYHAGLRPGVVALLRHLTPGDDRLRDAYFRWKHEENPFVAAPVAYVALQEDRVVGLRGFQGARWRLPGARESRLLLCACDLVVDPAHRGQRLHQRIMDVALGALRDEGHRTVLSFSANPITYRSSLQQGWRLVAPYATWAIETRRARAAGGATARMHRWPGVWRFAGSPSRIVLRRGFTTMEERWRRRAGVAEFTGELRADDMAALTAATQAGATAQARDPAYYRWRFRNPASEYRFAYWRGRSPTAFVALQRPRQPYGADISIVDYAAPDAGALLAVIGEIAGVGGFDRLSLWTVGLPQAVTERLGALGFAPRDMSRGDPAYVPGLLTIQLDRHGAASPAAPVPDDAPPSWDLRMIDSDNY